MTPEENKKKIQELRDKKKLFELEVSKIAQKVIPDYNSLWHVISDFWDCPESPIGLCVYDIHEDPYHDDCIFCHEPEERK